MLVLVHEDDGKGKDQSHSIRFEYIDEDGKADFPEYYSKNGQAVITGANIEGICSYGKTKDEAVENIGELLDWLVDEVTAIRDLYDKGVYQNNIKEVDWSGKLLDNK